MKKADDIAISINSVSKNFKLPHQKADSIKSLFINPLSLFGSKKDVEVQHALKDISFDIRKGEFFGIVGRNGSGKSTMLKILAGIYKPTAGSVHVAGKLVPFIELGVGFNPELTGRENVYLSCALNGFSESEVNEMYDDIVQFAELEPFMDQKLKNYSSGMQVRLAFSVATRAKADVLLIDEVLAVGDADFQRKCFEYFEQLKHDEITVVFVSHDMEAVKQFCDRAALIDKNHLIELGSSKEIAKLYSELFLDEDETATHSVDGTTEGTREGNGKAIIENPRISTDAKKITIKYDIVAKTPGRVVTGIRIRSLSGDDIMGSNNVHQDSELEYDEVNQEKALTWELPNILSDGKYLLDISIHDENSLVVYDWWNESVKFSVRRASRTPYHIEPEFTLVVE